jgi:MSHA pilin protein MshC
VKNRIRGFSLVELVVVMVIVAILSALAIPRLSDSEIKASWFGDQAKAAIRHAQRQAVAQHRNVYVDVQPGSIRLCYLPDCSSQLTQLTDGSAYTLLAPSGVAINPTTAFSFNALGKPFDAFGVPGGVALSIAGKSVIVTAETGYVQ